jgi:hypothetical protein
MAIDPGLDFFGHSVSAYMAMDELEQYEKVVSAFLVEARSRQEADSDQDDALYLFSEAFPALLHSSAIATVVSLIELETASFAQALQRATTATLSARDLRGSWIEQFRKYCEGVCGLDLDIGNVLWQDIRVVRSRLRG